MKETTCEGNTKLYFKGNFEQQYNVFMNTNLIILVFIDCISFHCLLGKKNLMKLFMGTSPPWYENMKSHLNKKNKLLYCLSCNVHVVT